MKHREWIGDVRVEAWRNIYTGKREWIIWIPPKFPGPGIPMEEYGTYATKPEAIREAKIIAKKRVREKKS